MSLQDTNVRPATATDGPFLLDLVNTQDVKFWSGRNKDIGPVEHAIWFGKALSDEWHHKVVIATHDGVRAGYGRLEFVTEARVSFAVDKAYRGQGIGGYILWALEQERAGAPLLAYVHPGNTPSLRAFLSQGYTLDEMRTEKGVMWQILRKG